MPITSMTLSDFATLLDVGFDDDKEFCSEFLPNCKVVYPDCEQDGPAAVYILYTFITSRWDDLFDQLLRRLRESGVEFHIDGRLQLRLIDYISNNPQTTPEIIWMLSKVIPKMEKLYVNKQLTDIFHSITKRLVLEDKLFTEHEWNKVLGIYREATHTDSKLFFENQREKDRSYYKFLGIVNCLPRMVYDVLLFAYAESNKQSEISKLPRDILEKISFYC